MQMEKTVVLYPGLAVSHFVPTMRLAGALLEHGYAVSVALIDPAVNPDTAFGAVVARATASMPSARFHTLPLVENPPRVTPGAEFVIRYFELVHLYNDRLHDFLRSFTRIHAVVVDSMSAEAIGVTKRLGILGYLMFTSSVVFLCFGSIGTANHSEEQIKEIAVGLENSGHRFMWVVRAPHGNDPDIDALLPHGFLERTDGRGLVLKQWAPQADVLRHRATGAFVTHCGWNSVLEGVTAGVPMLCWPLYSEQKMNKLLMVGEMGVAAEMVGWQRGLVEAGEVERTVRLVMESDEGREIKARVAAHKDAAAAAWVDGGSSRAAFGRFLSDVDGRRARACSGESA